jgi:hypothetical protein
MEWISLILLVIAVVGIIEGAEQLDRQRNAKYGTSKSGG